MVETPSSLGDWGEIAVLLPIFGAGCRWLWVTLQQQRHAALTAPQAKLDANMLTVSRARDELEADNDRLRATLREERDHHAGEKSSWETERASLRAEIEELETKLRALLNEVTDLKSRHGMHAPARDPRV